MRKGRCFQRPFSCIQAILAFPETKRFGRGERMFGEVWMTNTVLLNNIDHHDLRAAIRHGAEFGDSVNQMLVFPTEFEEIQREFPIFFRRDGEGSYQAVALLGLDRDENLFLGAQGWRSHHVPTIQQRGPFSIGLQRLEGEDGIEAMIHVDLDDPRIGRDEGELLFLPQGGNTPYLDHVARILRAIHEGLETEAPMFAAFEGAGLIAPVAVEIALDETARYTLPDLFTLSQERLAALDGAALERLHRAGWLRLAFLIVASLGNVSRLIDLKNRKRRAG